MSHLSRRSLLAGLAATPLLAACDSSSSSSQPSAAGSPGSRFSFTDARGKVIDLATVPTRIVAQSSAAAALWDAGVQVTGAYGELRTTAGKLDYQAGDLDLSKITVIGQTYGDFSLEKFVALNPQLLIDESFDNKTLWYVDAKVEKQVAVICPTLGVKMLGLNLVQVITELSSLAVKLGADPVTSASAKRDFEASAETLKSSIKAADGAKIAAFSFDSSTAYVANAAQNPDLAYLKSLGAQFVDVDSKPTDYFTQISYEKLGDYSGDLIIVDARNTYQGYLQQPTWKALPAVKAGRVFPWKPAAPYSYRASVSVLDGFTKAYSSLAS